MRKSSSRSSPPWQSTSPPHGRRTFSIPIFWYASCRCPCILLRHASMPPCMQARHDALCLTATVHYAQIMWALAGLFLCIQHPNDARVFLLIYSLTSLYFTGVMVRLMLVLAPALVLLSSVAISHTLSNFSEMAQVGCVLCPACALAYLDLRKYTWSTRWSTLCAGACRGCSRGRHAWQGWQG